MDSKILGKLELIENHAEQIQQLEQLLEKILESNQRSEKYLEAMWRMYQQMAQPKSGPQI